MGINNGSLQEFHFSENSEGRNRDTSNKNPPSNQVINNLSNSTSSIEKNNNESSLNNPSNDNGESNTDSNHESQ